MQLSSANRQWLADFLATHHRAPRVLHIGNIANNAYNNSKLLIEAGVDNDVLCYDYYHTMGCPEWEDADFSDTVADDLRPAWAQMNLNGFNRPHWFVQGPLHLCVDYLLAKQVGHRRCANQHWHVLSVLNRTHVGTSFAAALSERWTAARANVTSLQQRIDGLFRLDPVLAFAKLYGARRTSKVSLHAARAAILMFVWALVSIALAVRYKLFTFGRQGQRSEPSRSISKFRGRSATLVQAWSSEYPERDDVLTERDHSLYEGTIDRWQQLFAHYDVVIGYSTDGIWPLLSGKPYLAFEHGTIREIPYRTTTQGRNAAMTYRNAEHVFVTNFDCLASAQKLAPGRFTLINHPYDEDHGLAVDGWQKLRASLRTSLDSDLICFFPTRHDWVDGTGYADKSNDVFLLALAELRGAGLRIGAVCCDWGANVAQSKTLLSKAGLDAHVRWLKPMAMVQFERMALACDLVVDQFKLGAFGGIVFKAMAVGAPILTYLDQARLLEQYPEMPPVINCATQASIVEKLGPLVAAPGRLVELGDASRAWIKRYHAKQETVNLQLDQFRQLIGKHGAVAS